MKKGYFEIKRWNSDIDTFEVYFVEKQRFTATRQDLKDLRSLIDTVLGQPLTEGEGEEKGCRDCLCVDEVSDWCKGECLCHHKSQENKECEHPNEFQQLGIDKDERGTLCCIKCGYYRFSQPQQESKEEEYIDGFKIECEHGSRGRCLKCLGLEEPPKKEVTTKKEENCGELSKSPQELCYEGICPGEGKCDAVTKGWPHRHKRNGDWIYSRIEGKETFKPVQEQSKNEESKLDPWRNKYLVGTEEQVKELTRLGATDGVVHKFDEEEPSKKEEEVPQKILINGDIIGICKKGFRVTKEECIGCERGVKHVCIPEPSKKPVCYCGHPKERHFVQYKSLVEGNQLSCRHCECFEYADNELHNQGEI
jgi:hypothetical protein